MSLENNKNQGQVRFKTETETFAYCKQLFNICIVIVHFDCGRYVHPSKRN